MTLKQVTVQIEYRMLAGPSKPSWKALRARVRQDHHGNLTTFGSDLCSPTFTNIDACISASLLMLQHCERVQFVFLEPLTEPPRTYLHGRLIRNHDKITA